MQVKHLKEGDLTHKFVVTASEDYVKSVMSKAFVQTKSRVKMDGYRPGKIPDAIIRQRFQENILESVYNQLIDESNKAIKEKVELRLATKPQTKVVNIPKSLDDNKFEIEVIMESLPDISIPDFSVIKLDNYNLVLTKDDEEEAYKQFVRRFATKKLKKGKAADGDIVKITYKIPEAADETNEINVDANNSVTSKFISKGAGDSMTVTVPKALLGEDTEVLTTVNEVYTMELPKFDNDLAQKIGFENLEVMKNQAINIYKQRYIDDIKSLVKKRLFDMLDANEHFALPQQLVHAELHNIAHQNNAEHDCNIDHSEDQNLSMATRRVKLALLLQEIATKSKIQVTQEEVLKHLENMARVWGMDLKQFLQQLPSTEIINNVAQKILEDKTVDFILESAKVKSNDITIEELKKILKDEGLDDA